MSSLFPNMLALRMQSISCFKNKVGVLPVVDNDQISGIITDKDVFRAFLEISGYGQAGIRIGLEVPDTPRVLEKIAEPYR